MEQVGLFSFCLVNLYRGKEKIHSETQVVQYYKSRAVGVTSKVGLTTDQRPFRAMSLLLFLFLLPSA